MDFQISGVCCHFETLSLGGRLVDEIMAEVMCCAHEFCALDPANDMDCVILNVLGG